MPNRRQLANAIRALSMDAVQRANSGHPGMPMGMADIAEVLWNDFLKHNPRDTHWVNRDRFIVSNGHGSMLLYSLLHLTGYPLPMEELQNFRQWHSKTAGHPEYGLTPGVETTTGPLGQGLANAVGMALAEQMMAARFNRPGFNLIDHYTYVFLGDGCLMEGVSHEAGSLAGTLGLGKLIAFWDDNEISIDGDTKGWFRDDTARRFESYHWHVIANVDGHDAEQVKAAIEQARQVTDKPSLICCKTVIGYGAPNAAGTHQSHGAALGEAEVALTRKALDWPYAPFEIPDEIYEAWNACEKGQAAQMQWETLLSDYAKAHPDLMQTYNLMIKRELPANWSKVSNEFIAACQSKQEKIATRKASQNCLNAYAPLLPYLVGGSADLTGSNLTNWADSKMITHDDFSGNYIHFGVREFGMTAIANGMVLYGSFLPYVGTFLTFTDYARNAVRMAAIMHQPTILVYTHDSIGLGEDGPTHQPIEHIAMLRATPNLQVWRPCDATETAVAWKAAIESKKTPHALLLSRQGIRHEARSQSQVALIDKGGYILVDTSSTPDVILMATGSEVYLVVDAAKELQKQGINTRVVSMPCVEQFEEQSLAYKNEVLPSSVTARLAVEAGATMPWYKYVGSNGKVIGIDRFGESAPAEKIFIEFGFTVENIVKQVLAMLGA